MSPKTPRPSGPLPDPETERTISVDRAARLVGVSTRGAYAACERGDWPSVRVGRSIRVLTAEFLRQYRLTDHHDAA
jgi:hypothetical protein